MSDIVRVIRIVQYVGPRESVEKQIAKSIQGSRFCGLREGPIVISAATLGIFPETLNYRDALTFEAWSKVQEGALKCEVRGERL